MNGRVGRALSGVPANVLVGVLAGTAAFALVALAAVLVWATALRSDLTESAAAEGPPATGPPPPPAPVPPPPAGPPPEVETPKDWSLTLRVCGAVTEAGDCVGESFQRPAGATEFVVVIEGRNLEAGAELTVDLVRADTGESWLSGPCELGLEREPEEVELFRCTIGGGPWDPERLRIVVTLDGEPTEWDSELLLELR